MSQLDRITIKGYKSIRELNDFQLKPLNILIGANGAGKSNFVMLFDLLQNIISGNLQLTVGRSGGVDPFLYFGQKITEKIELELWFGSNGYKLGLLPGEGDMFVFSEETVCDHDKKHQFESRFGTGGHKESLLKGFVNGTHILIGGGAQLKKKIATGIFKSITNWQIYHFHDTSDSARVKKTGI